MNDITQAELDGLKEIAELYEVAKDGDVGILRFLIALKKQVNKSETDLSERLTKAIESIEALEKLELKDGATPKRGEDYYTEQDIQELIDEVFSRIEIPTVKDGVTPRAGVDYPTRDQIREYINNLFSTIPRPKDGKDAVVDYDLIMLDVLSQIPVPKDGSPDTGEEIIAKINFSKTLIRKEHIEGLVDAINNIQHTASLPVTTAFYNGLRAKNLTIIGGTARQEGDTVYVTVSSGSGQVNSVVAGAGIDVDATDPANPIVSTEAPETPTGTVDGNNVTFTVTRAPHYINVDGLNKYESLGYTYSTGTITIIDGAPPFVYIRSHSN